jgi:histidinol phosphatase-like enzyme
MGIDLAASYMVGDHVRDVLAATRAGVTPVLVRTGHGAKQLDDPKLREIVEGVRVEEDLRHAVRWIVGHGKQDP